MRKIYKVFVSSTYEDLMGERESIINALLANGYMPTAMEFFGSSPNTPVEEIRERMRDCDYYVLIIKEAYGSVVPVTGKSYTEMEYDLALELGLPPLVFLHKELKSRKTSEGLNKSLAKKLKAFVDKASQHTVSYWTDTATLRETIVSSLNNFVKDHPAKGYVKNENEDKPISYDSIDVQEKKTACFQFVQLRREVDAREGRRGVSFRYIERLDSNERHVPVHDEFLFYQINEFAQPVSGFVVSNQTSGVVDLSILHPWQPKLFFPEGVTLTNAKMIEQTLRGNGRTLVTVSRFLNAFQTNQSIRTKMEKKTKEAVLVADFRYLPNGAAGIDATKVKGSLIVRDEEGNPVEKEAPVNISQQQTVRENEYAPLLFWISERNMQKGDFLKLDFSAAIDWQALADGE